MTERMKPPARPKGRVLGGAAKNTAPPPPPPAAELTPEQFAAEQDAGQPTAEVAPSGSEQRSVPSQRDRPAVVAPQSGTESAGEPVGWRTPQAVPPAEPAGQPTQSAEPVAQHDPPLATSAASAAAPSADVAVRGPVPHLAGGRAFPVRADGPGSHQEQAARSQEAPSEGTPYAHGLGRPKDIPEAAVVLNQRIIARESLDSSVPSALRLKKRIKRFALDNELDHLPIGDIVSVALDEWLTTRGF